MKRIHAHVTTRDLEKARAYYTALFGQGPTVEHDDYLKWRLDDPAINLAVSPGRTPGIQHLGLDLESDDELSTLRSRLDEGGYTQQVEEGAHCCYAYSDKVWSQDGDGVVWEGFLTHELADTRESDVTQPCCGNDSTRADDDAAQSCCAR